MNCGVIVYLVPVKISVVIVFDAKVPVVQMFTGEGCRYKLQDKLSLVFFILSISSTSFVN